VHYTIETDSVSIKGPGEPQFVGYEEYTGDFSPFVSAIGMAQTVGLSEDPSSMGTVLNEISTDQGNATGSMADVLNP
tara:strand:- start:161 stop:391 length:231 start_codon:yes stop_codon:yes gene_type:complete